MRMLLLLMSLCPIAAMADDVYVSPASKVTLVELYTSEGCSSCPPADRWLAELRQSDRLWRDIVPVAFHVDYWDYLGWRDGFSSAAHSTRQRTYAAQSHIESVYTPGIVVNGAEYREFFNPILRRRALPEATGEPGRLVLDRSGERVKLTFRGAPEARLIGHLTYLGLDIERDIRRGENAGKTLRHEFVVLEHVTVEGSGTLSFDSHEVPAGADAIAAWVAAPGDLRPVQAVGGLLTEAGPVSAPGT